MTSLVVEDKIENSFHEFSFELQNRNQIAGFYPYLFLVGNPSGSFHFKVNNGSRDVFSKTFSASDIRESMSSPIGALRVFFPVLPEIPMILGRGNYTARIEADDYTPNSSSYLGWIREHENLTNSLEQESSDSTANPCSLKIKEYALGAMP